MARTKEDDMWGDPVVYMALSVLGLDVLFLVHVWKCEKERATIERRAEYVPV